MFGQIILIGAIIKSLELQRLGLFLFRVSKQGVHFHDTGESLRHDGGQHDQDANELYQKMTLFSHGLESEVDEGIEVGDTECASG